MSRPSIPTPSASLARQLIVAAHVVAGVRGGQSVIETLAELPAPARPAAQALAFECLRHMASTEAALRHLSGRPPKEPVHSLVLLALALLRPGSFEAYSKHALVSQAVEAAKHMAAPTAGFVNAVLRRTLREGEALWALSTANLATTFEHPDWWIRRMQADWPEQWSEVLAAANERPPMYLRVNFRRTSGPAYLKRLLDTGVDADLALAPWLGSQAIALKAPCAVQRLPDFDEGHVSVQDLSAQRAARLLMQAGLDEGARVLDACSAPGGKAAHLLELADLDLLCVDSSRERSTRITQTLSRLGLSAQVLVADASEPATWWDRRPFDAILLDAPCSASGISRRHPDIRWLRRPGDIDALASKQDHLLDALWPLLKPGGHLLFATCSVFKSEGQERVDAFLQRPGGRDAYLAQSSPGHILPVAENAISTSDGRCLLPDGFFYALLKKQT